MPDDSKQIVVVGAGIAGLTTALCLNHFGIKSCVYERSNEVTTAGAGIQLSPNANRVFSHIGLFDEISALSRRCKGVRVFDYKSNSQLALFDYMKFKRDAAFLLCHRSDLVSILYAACIILKIPIHLKNKLEKKKKWEVIFSDVNVYSPDIIVGAVGLHSNVRKAVIDEETPIFTHQIAWRSIVPNSINQDDFAHVTLAPKRHLVSYPINDGSQLNLVLIKEQNEWQPDGWKHPEDPKVVKESFKDFSGEASKIIASIESVYKWGLFRYPVKKKWYNDRVILVGDAAHPTLPFLAQGAAMAIEDSFVIASKISKFPKLSFAFNEFQRERLPRVQRIISASAKNARTFHLSNVISRLVLHFFLRLLTKFLPHLLVKRFDWIYDHNVTN